jgi:cyclic pyranopterin phosphate synthase
MISFARESRRRLPLVVEAAHVPEVTEPPREPRAVRLSLTDRCDLACVYCRPSRSDGYFEQRLGEEAWRTMVRALLRSGIRRVRITGGEPLLHPHVVEMVRFLSEQGLEDLALTTNATQLARLARPLRDAGLRRITVSLDTLDEERFAEITRGGRLHQVLAGIEAARAVRFEELKINCVVLRGKNDDEIEKMTLWAWEKRIVPRFIELMRVGEGARLAPEALVGYEEMLARVAHLVDTREEARVDPDRGPAKYLGALHDPRLRVGFITGSTHTYCESCDRMRVAADGMLRPCLATNDGVAAMGVASAGDEEGVVRAVAEAWQKKPDGRTWKGCTEKSAAEVSMRATGG